MAITLITMLLYWYIFVVNRCPTPLFVSHSTRSTTNVSSGTVINYRCNYGYILGNGLTEFTATCEESQWQYDNIGEHDKTCECKNSQVCHFTIIIYMFTGYTAIFIASDGVFL